MYVLYFELFERFEEWQFRSTQPADSEGYELHWTTSTSKKASKNRVNLWIYFQNTEYGKKKKKMEAKIFEEKRRRRWMAADEDRLLNDNSSCP